MTARRTPASPPTTPASAEPSLSLRQTVVAVFVTYAAITLAASILALLTGSTTDTHEHLLIRFGVTVIGIGAFYVYGRLRWSFPTVPASVAGLATYAVALAVTLACVWAYGLVGYLHPTAYRDMILNFTAVALVLSGAWRAVTWWRRRAHRA